MSLPTTLPPSYPPHQIHILPPSPSPSLAPSSSPSPSPITPVEADYFNHQSSPPPPKSTVNFSPPLIAMVVVVATAFLIVSYYRIISRQAFRIHHRLSRWRRRGHSHSYLPSSSADPDSPPLFIDSPFNQSESFHVYSPYGLDDSVIKTIPLSLYTTAKPYQQKSPKDCAVCLLEFEDNEYVRTLPVCSHAFHVDCIDMWLRSHANCPLCRAGIFRQGSESPFVPLMAARIRPSFDEDISILNDIILEEPTETGEVANSRSEITTAVTTEITEENVPTAASEDRFSTGREFVLKRSYSFGFERSLASERMVMEPTTASPWRYRRSSGSFWSKRPSPFGSLTKSRVFSFRHYRGMKSPFFRRRGFFPSSESRVGRFHGVGGGSSRRSKSMASPMFGGRLSATAAFSSSRLRCGDPEALLSPERFNSSRR